MKLIIMNIEYLASPSWQTICKYWIFKNVNIMHALFLQLCAISTVTIYIPANIEFSKMWIWCMPYFFSCVGYLQLPFDISVGSHFLNMDRYVQLSVYNLLREHLKICIYILACIIIYIYLSVNLECWIYSLSLWGTINSIQIMPLLEHSNKHCQRHNEPWVLTLYLEFAFQLKGMQIHEIFWLSISL